ncbi:cytochrome [Mycobacterium alsense]|uniref:Cytochrome n=1 Tax=Mycobacterium alsense TaxID=324058 RepID=A0AA41XM51_9MYCO|nr:cytochrome P450 [Mycobacterium alsense]MCV7377942.1 cytochrome P450 [Mycobacterium alsense]OQZ88808.1 cytochrome [Mycobacterium alsense]
MAGSIADGGTDLPVIPLPRASGCPLAPPPEFTQWRRSPGLQRATWQGKPVWVVSRYEDIRAALTDSRLSADTNSMWAEAQSSEEAMPVIFARIDDPEHNRLRRMMTRDFTFRRADEMRPRIQELVDQYIDKMVEHGPPADLVHDFALPVPSLVISVLLGVPDADLESFQHNSTTVLDSGRSDEERLVAGMGMYGYMLELVDRKEREPGDDLISRLVTNHVVPGELSRETAAMTAMIMLQAGHETTASMIALGALALMQHPDDLARLRTTEDNTEIANIVDELLRYLTVVHSLVERVAKEDFTLGGQPIRAGDLVLMNLPAGNWDTAYTSGPETFDIARNTRGHLAFGYGAHQCIGQNLARAELQIALATLVRRLPGLRLAVSPDDLQFQAQKEIYGVECLPVTW